MIILSATVKREVPLWLTDTLSCPPGCESDCYLNEPNIGPVKAYHKLWERHCDERILAYFHDDLTIYEPWIERVRCAFLAPQVAIVGFGGATGIGSRDLYRKPYQIEQLARTGYASNQTDWEVHGSQETEERTVAVVDGYAMVIRGKFLKEVGGWDWIQSNFHCYDTAMCLEAIRRGWEVRTVGISCTHNGGGTSTQPEYAEWCREHDTTMEEEHAAPHRWLYDRYRDLLPYEVKP